MNMIEVKGLRKSFGELTVLKDISFTAQKSDVIAIIGSSGSGKSTMLRCLINLEKSDGGTIVVEGDKLLEDGSYAHPKQVKKITARMGMVFQSFNLFPHYTVRQNLIKPAQLVKKMPADQAQERCEQLLAKVGLLDKANEFPSRLSGGQKQRVAIARALMLSPDIMLFDEPTSALDPQLTGEVMTVIRQLAEEQMTMLVVTHEMSFARDVANKVLFMHDARICDAGSPQEVLVNPRNQLVADFIGNGL